MTRRRFQLSKEQVKELTRAFQYCKDGATRTRYQAVRLYGTGYPVKEVEEITGCSRASLMEWCRAYRDTGVAGLIDKRKGGNRAKMTPMQIEDLQARLHTYTPAQLFGSSATTSNGQFWTVEDLAQAVRQWYDVSYRSRSSYLRLFGLCGFSYQRPAKVFKSRSEVKVAEFEAELEKKAD